MLKFDNIQCHLVYDIIYKNNIFKKEYDNESTVDEVNKIIDVK